MAEAQEELKSIFLFYKGYARENNKNVEGAKRNYVYDSNGNLVDKKTEKTIPLNTYRPTTAVEIDEIEKSRKVAIAEAEAAYEDEIRKLRQLVDEDASIIEIFNQNENVKSADYILQKARYVELELSNDVNMRLPIFTPFDLSNLYTRIGEAVQPEKPKKSSGKKTKVILFENTEDPAGFLTLQYQTVIIIDDIPYNNAYQAVMAQMARFFGDDLNLGKIMEADSADEIVYNNTIAGKEAEEWAAQYDIVLMDVNEKKFEQNPQLAQLLVSTGKIKLGAIIPGDNVYGIGVASGTLESKDPGKWSGQNKLGQIIENVRTLLINRKAAEQQAVVAPVEEVVVAAPAVAAPVQEVIAAAPEQVAPAAVAPEVAAPEQAAPAAAAPEQAAPAAAAPEQAAPAAAVPEQAAAPEKAKRKLRFIPPSN